MQVGAFSIQTSRDHYAWTGTIELLSEAEFNTLTLNSALSFTLQPGPDADGNARAPETFGFIVDSLEREEAFGSLRLMARVISPAARYDAPRANTIDRTWGAPTAASAIAASLVPVATWNATDWTVAADRFTVSNQAPLQALSTLAQAIGGRLQSTPAGALSVVPRFPVSAPYWSTAPVFAVLTDDDDTISRAGTGSAEDVFNAITVSDGVTSETSPSLTLEIDDRPDGPNEGRTQFAPGETCHLRVWHPSSASVSVTVTAGTVSVEGSNVEQVTEVLQFVNTATAGLSKPAIALTGTQWVGAAHGGLSLSDPQTVTAGADVTGLARVTYTARYTPISVTLPSNIGGVDEFEVLAVATAPDTTTSGVTVTVARGGVAGDPITDALCCTTAAATARANAELDEASQFTHYRVEAVYLPRIMPGHLIEVHESRSGEIWRAMVDAVEHRFDERMTTSLDVLRLGVL